MNILSPSPILYLLQLTLEMAVNIIFIKAIHIFTGKIIGVIPCAKVSFRGLTTSVLICTKQEMEEKALMTRSLTSQRHYQGSSASIWQGYRP